MWTQRFIPTDREFLVFWLAQAISRFGDPITLIALSATAYRLTGSAFITSLAVVVATLPQALVGFLGGAIADSTGLRRSMVAADCARVVLVGAIPIVLALGLPLAFAFGLVLLAGACAAVFNPARVAAVPLLLNDKELGRGNSMMFASDRTVEIVGAVVGGFLVANLGDAAFYADAATFLVSAVLLSRLRLAEPPPTPTSLMRVWNDVLEGLRFIRRTEVLYLNTVVSLIAQVSASVSNALLPVLIFRRFAGGDSQLGATQFGIAEGALAVGGVAMGIAYQRSTLGVRKGRLLVAGWGAYGSLLVAVAIAPSFEIACLALIGAGVANVLFYVPNVTISQQVTPRELRARVFGARISLLSISAVPVMVVAGILADSVDISLLIAIAGAFTLVVALVASRIPAVADVP